MRSHGRPFHLTAAEARVLPMVRAGMSGREIAQALGVKSSRSSNHLVVNAVEKERLLVLAQRDRSRPGGVTTLQQARGDGRAGQQNPRKGTWKSGTATV